jgi:hypothetical protein
MTDIIFEYVPSSNPQGYGIWAQDSDGIISLLGFCSTDKMGEHMKEYQDQGHHVIIRRDATEK